MTRKTKGLEALFGVRHGILFCTHLEPGRWWSTKDLAGHPENQQPGFAEHLEILREGEILRARVGSDDVEYQANPDSPFFAEIQAMMAKAATRDRPSGAETILVVDDQAATLKVARILLESFGYSVLAATSGQEALILFRQHQERIRLLLTDVVMPDITGPDLLERLRRIKPELRVIYMSGYPDAERLSQASAFLAKPFNPAGLSKVVREALDAE